VLLRPHLHPLPHLLRRLPLPNFLLHPLPQLPPK
jgi:hypothetical protein